MRGESESGGFRRAAGDGVREDPAAMNVWSPGALSPGGRRLVVYPVFLSAFEKTAAAPPEAPRLPGTTWILSKPPDYPNRGGGLCGRQRHISHARAGGVVGGDCEGAREDRRTEKRAWGGTCFVWHPYSSIHARISPLLCRSRRSRSLPAPTNLTPTILIRPPAEISLVRR